LRISQTLQKRALLSLEIPQKSKKRSVSLLLLIVFSKSGPFVSQIRHFFKKSSFSRHEWGEKAKRRAFRVDNDPSFQKVGSSVSQIRHFFKKSSFSKHEWGEKAKRQVFRVENDPSFQKVAHSCHRFVIFSKSWLIRVRHRISTEKIHSNVLSDSFHKKRLPHSFFNPNKALIFVIHFISVILSDMADAFRKTDTISAKD